MTRPRLLLTRLWPDACQAAAAEHFDLSVDPDDTPLSPTALAEAMKRFDALGVTVTDKLDAAVFEGATTKLLANFGVGVSHIDLEAARSAGVMVTNTPGVLTDATADMAMALMLAVMRRLGEGEREIRGPGWAGWRPTHLIGAQVTGATLGVIGFGRIGQAMARRAHFGFGMRVLAQNRSPIDPTIASACGAEPCADIETLLPQCDVVSLHCPGGAANRHLIDARRLSLLKPGAFLINTARGEVVDEAALAAALAATQLAGAGLDVFEEEPVIHPGLITLENVVMAPHLGSATASTREAMGMKALDNLCAVFEGREPPDRVA